MRRVLITLTVMLCIAATAPSVRAQAVSPAPGVEMPPEVKMNSETKGMFEFKHAWLEKASKARETRERYIDERGFYKRDMIQASSRPQFAVSGNFAIPIFCVKYSTTGADPFPIANLQTKLFNGPFAPQTMTQFYNEISYGDLHVTGTVYGWTTLPNTEVYYAGTGTCNGLCGGTNSHIPQLINSTLTTNDGAINFGQYDNDGPDDVPNSGDDDGFVDFVSFVHPTLGAECGVNGHIWSHRFSLTGQGVGPFTTNDARTGGGFIKVDDYTIQPVKNCDNTTLIDIGVFCHEFGHAFGLPDLYDTNGGSQGVGWWCLMSSGNWNQPTKPAHMCAWSKTELGWSDVIVVPSVTTPFSISNVENNRQVYRLDVMHEKWRRTTSCPITGSYSMHCGLTTLEATNRHWANTAGSGYGNYWDTTVSRDFNYNGSGSVALQYQYTFALEPSYDYGYGTVTSGGVTNTFAIYNNPVLPGTGSGTANINLTPYLSAGPYTVSFRVIADGAWADEDGSFTTTCGAMSIDNISVVGGGENHLATFETREDGWAENMNPPTEHFFVENRQPLGSDAYIAGGGGLVIMHVDAADQTGGPSNNRPRGLAVMQADGLGNLEANLNRGDGGDPYPGTSNNQNLNGLTLPNSNGYDGASTVAVALTSGYGDPMSANMIGGWPAPVPTTVTPNTSGTATFQLQLDGSAFAKVGSVDLVGGAQTFSSTTTEWVGKDRILASFDLTGAANDLYDVVVFNPGGASAVLTDAFEFTGAVSTPVGDGPRKFALLPAYPNPFNPETTIRYELAARTHVSLRVYDVSGAVVRTLVNDDKAAGSYALSWNGRDDHGSPVSSGVYFYRITAGSFSDVRKMTLLK